MNRCYVLVNVDKRHSTYRNSGDWAYDCPQILRNNIKLMHSTSLAYASTTVGWDAPVTEDVLRKLNPKKPTHPWLVAAAWLILCFIAPMYNGGLTEGQTKSLDAVWRESLPSHERDVDPNIF